MMKIALLMVTAFAGCAIEDDVQDVEQSVQQQPAPVDSCRLIAIPASADPWVFCRAQGCVGFYQYPSVGGTPICTGSTTN